ncbi:MAG: CCA tRNA nucleotidyltransferase [Dehalococcoidia bacterium]|nr:CCA tRNA nucleotidyltransferase [Dehalococcoidia bacterium]
MLERLEHHLSKSQLALLRSAGGLAERAGTPAYLVGGSVRDLLLDRPVLDLDLVVEGDAAALASRFAAELGGSITARSQFGTVKLKTAADVLDIATARTESYAHPGALPTVRPGAFNDDLARRDFTINTLAIHLSPAQFGVLVDPFGGAQDLRDGLLRVLHERSFQDDATRMLRGVRYEARLGFRMDAATEKLAQRDARFLGTISPDRLRRELQRMLGESHPERCLSRAQGLGLLDAMLPGLAWPPSPLNAVTLHGQAPAPTVFLALMTWPLSEEQAEIFVRRLNLSGRARGLVWDTARLRRGLPLLNQRELRPSAAYQLLRALEPDAIQAALVLLEGQPDLAVARERLTSYLELWREVRPRLTPPMLLALGVPPGPLVGRYLERLLANRLDDPSITADGEKDLVQQWLREEPPAEKGRAP